MNLNDITEDEQKLILSILYTHTSPTCHNKCVRELKEMGFENTLETAYVKLSIVFSHYGETGFPFPPKR